MKRITVKNTVLIDQSANEPVLWGGYQIPYIRCAGNTLYIKFMGRKDSVETYGMENLDPIYSSTDGGATWQRSNIKEWRSAAYLLPNGDRLDFIQRKSMTELPPLPPAKKHGFGGDSVSVYTIDELSSIIPNLDKSITVSRLRPGESEPVVQVCPVNWSGMPVDVYKTADGQLLVQLSPCENDLKIDKNGVLWLPVYCNAAISENESPESCYNSVHLLRSDDCGYTWDHVSAVYYDEGCQSTDAFSVEGFNEATLEILDNGDFLMIMRSGSIFPKHQGSRPMPKMFSVRSCDGGKTWSRPEEFYPYGIHPHSLRTSDGTLLLISGRPGVYMMSCDDPEGRAWSDITELVHVPEEDSTARYFEYSCSNADICICENGRIFATYSDFKHKTPSGEPAKSIFVAEISVENG